MPFWCRNQMVYLRVERKLRKSLPLSYILHENDNLTRAKAGLNLKQGSIRWTQCHFVRKIREVTPDAKKYQEYNGNSNKRTDTKLDCRETADNKLTINSLVQFSSE